LYNALGKVIVKDGKEDEKMKRKSAYLRNFFTKNCFLFKKIENFWEKVSED